MMATPNLQIPIDGVHPHPRNVRQGDVGAIATSLEAHGQYRPIVYQLSSGNIIAGNHTWKAAKSLGWVTIAATAFDCDDEQALRILLVDNRTGDLATYDDAALVELLKELSATDEGLSGTMFDGDDLDLLISDLERDREEVAENIYSQIVTVPQYQMTGEKPTVGELYDAAKAETLLRQIAASKLPPEVARFLEVAASRHVVFNYSKIAEYFAHSTPEIQKLMRESVLVIIDLKDAMRLGYLRFAKRLNELEEIDNEEA